MKNIQFYMVVLVISIAFCLLPIISMFSQTPDWLWAKRLGGIGWESVSSIIVDPVSGDVYTTGNFYGTVDFDPGTGIFNLTSDGSADIFISKLTSDGNFVWAKVMGGSGMEYAFAITVDPLNGDVYTTGAFHETADFDPDEGTFYLTTAGGPGDVAIFVSKLDDLGNFVWAKAIGGIGLDELDEGHAIALDVSGNIYTTGFFSGTADFDPGPETFNLTSAGGHSIFISKFDPSGNFVWARAMGGTSFDWGWGRGLSIAVDPSGSGGVYTTGVFSGTVDLDPGPGIHYLTGDENMFISKLDDLGNFVWAGSLVGIGNDIVVDPIGSKGIYTTGYFSGTKDFDSGSDTFNLTSAGNADIFISKLDSLGNFMWAKSLGGNESDEGSSVVADASGNVYISGYFSGTADFDPGLDTFNLISTGSNDIFILKLDNSGNFLWAKSAGGTRGEYGISIALDDFGNVQVAGSFESPSILFGSDTIINQDSSAYYEEGIPYYSTDIFIAKLDATNTLPVVEITTYQINLYPNPATNELTIELDESEFHNVKITLYNILGEVVFSSIDQYFEHDLKIDISKLPTAIYFIELDIDGKRVMKKVVKE